MAKRWAIVAVVVATIAVSAGCLPEPPPASALPSITQLVVSPSPVVAGQPFTVTATATDDVTVTAVEIGIYPPYRLNPSQDAAYPHVECDDPPFTPGLEVTRQFTCTLPDFVPNGQWKVRALARNVENPQYNGVGSTTFDLVGGSEDRVPPVLISQSVPTEPVVAGQPFTITVQVSDEHPSPDPVSAYIDNIVYQVPDPPPVVEWTCGPASPVALSATVQQWTFPCLVPPDAAPAWYGGVVSVPDAIGHELVVWLDHFQIVAPA